MKKIFTLLTVLLLAKAVSVKAQDTLLYEGFQFVMDSYLNHITSPPAGVNVDSMWYDYDADQLADGSGSSTPRKDDWFQVLSYADTDLYVPGTMDTNIVMGSNSWFSSPGLADNWLITRNIQLGDHDTLYWRAAPFQTPRYLDGYEVKLSTTNNDDLSFTHVLFTAAEMTGLSQTAGDSSIFANHVFSAGFVHGEDSTYIESKPSRPTAAYTGVLRPFFVALDPYANQNVFIAFHHNSFDDNLISIDDILIRGTASNPTAGITEKSKLDLNLNVFPNPAEDHAQLNFQLATDTEVLVTVTDITGKVIYSENKGKLQQGRHFAMINTASLSKGFYTLAVQTNSSRNTTKLIVK